MNGAADDGTLEINAHIVSVTTEVDHAFGENARYKGRQAVTWMRLEFPEGVRAVVRLPAGASLADLVQAVADDCIVGTEVAVVEADRRDMEYQAGRGAEAFGW